MASFIGIYARAMADVAMQRKLDANKVGADLESLTAILQENPQLRTIWESPSVNADQKLKLLDAIVARAGVSREVRNFTAVLITKRRIHFFAEIARAAVQQLNAALGIAEAQIVSARELSADERSKLESQVTKVTGKKLRVSYSLDPSLMGGAVVRVGSTIYDGSVRGQLQRMREQLANA
jgi:F-type H+-transporting ATPase subunit delta